MRLSKRPFYNRLNWAFNAEYFAGYASILWQVRLQTEKSVFQMIGCLFNCLWSDMRFSTRLIWKRVNWAFNAEFFAD